MTTAFWDDHARDMEDPEYRHHFIRESQRIVAELHARIEQLERQVLSMHEAIQLNGAELDKRAAKLNEIHGIAIEARVPGLGNGTVFAQPIIDVIEDRPREQITFRRDC
jgi:hypothetical protein